MGVNRTEYAHCEPFSFLTLMYGGRALQEASSTWLMRSCINVSGLCLERVLRAIMDISAHAT